MKFTCDNQPCQFNQYYAESLQNLGTFLGNNGSQKSLFLNQMINKTCCPIEIS